MTFLNLYEVNAFYGSVQILKEVSLQVKQEQIVALVGANGAGKTTLLRSISGLGPTYSGSISFMGRPIEEKSSQERVELGLVHIPEGRKLFPSLSVADNLDLGAFVNRAKKDKKDTLLSVFELFPVLRERQYQIAGTLSGGEQQMVAVARGLMGKPKLLMLDEPSLGLAPKVVISLLGTLKEIRKRGVTVLLVEQNIRQSLSISDFAYVLETGKIVMEGPAMEVLYDEHIRVAYLGMK